MLKIFGIPDNKKTFERIARMPQAISRGLKRGSLLAGKHTQHVIRKELARIKSGEPILIFDFWTDRMIWHKPSVKGEAPARISGSLKQSVNYVARSDQLIIGAGTDVGGGEVQTIYDAGYPNQVDLGGQIGFGRVVDYAKPLETLKRRPYLRTNVKGEQKVIWNYLCRMPFRELIR